MAKSDLSSQELKELYEYNPTTGEFLSRKFGRNQSATKPAGFMIAEGYRRIHVRRYGYYAAHRLAWLYCYGELPTLPIDHINGVKSDNRISNLRLVSTLLNNQHIWEARSTSVSGLLGVSDKGNRFTAMIKARLAGRTVQLYLGSYATAEEAHAVYMDAKRLLHEGYIDHRPMAA